MIDIQQGYSIGVIVMYGFVLATIINAINVVFWEGHIFQRIGDYMEANYPTLWKPIGGCVICMSPYYGAFCCWLFGWPWLSIIVAMGINVIIVRWEPEKD